MANEPTEESDSALKEIFNAERFRSIARETAAVYPAFDRKRFLAVTLPQLDPLNLLQRLRLVSQGLHATLPANYRQAVAILRRLAPRIDRSFVTLALCDYIGQYGLDDFDTSLKGLKFLTPFGSAEFAIREFLRRDFDRTLAVMKEWSTDEDEHVRRLASEGSRPRLPWSFRLDNLVRDPSPTAPILENLKADPTLYVRKSVANHLNDITKDHPELVLDRIGTWDLTDKHTAWIARHALRTLIKKGDRRALTVIGAGEPAKVKIPAISVTPARIKLGEQVTFSFTLESTATKEQRLVVDYAVHYVKKSGSTSPKVFKLKELTLPAKGSVTITKRQTIQNFTTREHHPGLHQIDILVNGEIKATGSFHLSHPH